MRVRHVGVALVASGFALAGCSNSGLTAAQQKYVNDVGSPGISAFGTQQELIAIGNQVCSTLKSGVTASQLNQQFESQFKGNQFTEVTIASVDAIDDLCPQYEYELPSS